MPTLSIQTVKKLRSRNGALQFDAWGIFVLPTNGFRLQGMMAAPDGSYPASSIGDIRIPFEKNHQPELQQK